MTKTVAIGDDLGAFIHSCGVKTTKTVIDEYMPPQKMRIVPEWAQIIVEGCGGVRALTDGKVGPRIRMAKYVLRRANHDLEFREAALAAIDANVLTDFVRQQRAEVSDLRGLFSSEIEAAYGSAIKEIKCKPNS